MKEIKEKCPLNTVNESGLDPEAGKKYGNKGHY